MRNALKRLLFLIVSTSLLGCTALDEHHKFAFVLEQEDVNASWPYGHEIAHYIYLGDIIGEQNLLQEQQKQQSALQKFWRFVIGESEQAPVELKRPQSIAVNTDGRIYITDVANQSVFVFDQKQGSLAQWPSAKEHVKFVSPIGISLGKDNEILVSDSELGKVFRLDASTGMPNGVLAAESLKRPTGVTFDQASNNIYVVDTQTHDIKVFSLDGALLYTLGKRGNGEGDFNGPTFIAKHPDGLLIADTLAARVQLIEDQQGQLKFLKSFAQRGMRLGDVMRPKGVASDSDGNVYIIESYFDHMLVYNRQGQFLMPLGGTGQGPGQFYLPSGIWVDQQDRIYVVDMMNGRVSVFQFLGGK
ncbi:6-bladed beta-propeller [Thalassotalea aquiviva]|uniref:6-bladed beta-propeller n=1 Tax=Thalassotalea aquiviva TaxID=3242415 RepID=UPI00352B8F14